MLVVKIVSEGPSTLAFAIVTKCDTIITIIAIGVD